MRSSIAFGDFRRGYLVVDRAGRARAARSVHRQALRAVLHDQARRRRRAGFRRDQAAEVRGIVVRRRFSTWRRGLRAAPFSPRSCCSLRCPTAGSRRKRASHFGSLLVDPLAVKLQRRDAGDAAAAGLEVRAGRPAHHAVQAEVA